MLLPEQPQSIQLRGLPPLHGLHQQERAQVPEVEELRQDPLLLGRQGEQRRLDGRPSGAGRAERAAAEVSRRVQAEQPGMRMGDVMFRLLKDATHLNYQAQEAALQRIRLEGSNARSEPQGARASGWYN